MFLVVVCKAVCGVCSVFQLTGHRLCAIFAVCNVCQRQISFRGQWFLFVSFVLYCVVSRSDWLIFIHG